MGTSATKMAKKSFSIAISELQVKPQAERVGF